MIPIYLKFVDYSEAARVLLGLGWMEIEPIFELFSNEGQTPSYIVHEGPELAEPCNPNMHIIGDLYTRPVMDGMTVVTPATLRPGYHVNALVEEIPPILHAYAAVGNDCSIAPKNPACVFAGWHPDEIAAREAAKNAPPPMLPADEALPAAEPAPEAPAP